MKLHRLRIPELIVVEPAVHGDARGYFLETWNRDRFRGLGLDFSVAQVNLSRSAHGVLRGLHYQWPKPQGKFVSVLEGEVWDVAVDIRRGSPTFGQWEAVVISAVNRKHLWIPEGFAHGFVVLSEFATFNYLCTEVYDRECDASVRWNDPAFAVDWPIADPQLSSKDKDAPMLADVPEDRLPTYTPPP